MIEMSNLSPLCCGVQKGDRIKVRSPFFSYLGNRNGGSIKRIGLWRSTDIIWFRDHMLGLYNVFEDYITSFMRTVRLFRDCIILMSYGRLILFLQLKQLFMSMMVWDKSHIGTFFACYIASSYSGNLNGGSMWSQLMPLSALRKAIRSCFSASVRLRGVINSSRNGLGVPPLS